jgi:hypothetical protein
MAPNLGPPRGMTKAEWEAWRAAHPDRNSVTDDPIQTRPAIDEGDNAWQPSIPATPL